MTLVSVVPAMISAAIVARLLVAYFDWRRTMMGRVLEKREPAGTRDAAGVRDAARTIDQAA